MLARVHLLRFFAAEIEVMRVLEPLWRSPSVATWVSYVARALSLFALSPLVLIEFSSAEAAVWFLLITLQGMQLLFETSIGAGFIRAMGYALGGSSHVGDQRDRAKNQVEPNTRLLNRVWGTMGRSYLLVALATFALLVALAAWSATRLIQQADLGWTGYLCVALFAFGACVRAYVGRHMSFLFACGRIPLLRWTEAVYWGLAFVSACSALALDTGLLGLAIAYQIPLVLGLVRTVWLTARDQEGREGFDRRAVFDAEILGQLWPGFWRSGLGVAVFLLVTQGTGLYYARVGNAADVAAYLFAMSLMRPMMQFAQVPFFTKLPQLTELYALGDHVRQVSLAARGMRWSMVLLCALVLGTAIGLWLLETLGLSETHVPALLWAIIGLAAACERLGAMHLQFYSTTNHILWHWANGGAAILFVLCAAFLLPPLGVIAFPLAHLIAMVLFYTPFSMVCSYRAFGLPWPRFEASVSLWPMLLLVAYGGLTLLAST